MDQREIKDAIEATTQKLVKLLGAWKDSETEGPHAEEALWARIRIAEDAIGAGALAYALVYIYPRGGIGAAYSEIAPEVAERLALALEGAALTVRSNSALVTGAPGYGRCPNCGELDPELSVRERRPNGFTVCGSCGVKTPSRDWKRG